MAEAPTESYLNPSWLDPETPRLYDWYDEYPYDVEAWVTICEQGGGPVLDVACGTGRMAIELARRGFSVHGVDFSPAMLARAQEKAAQEEAAVRRRLRFSLGDMADLHLGRRFPTTIVPCFSFNELTTLEAQEACLRSLSRHLRHGGLLALACGLWQPHARTTPPQEPAEWGKPLEEGLNPHTGRHTRMWSLSWGEAATQRRYHRFYFEELREGGGEPRRFASPPPPAWHATRDLGRFEAELLLEKCGYELEAVYGGWSLEPFDSESNCMLLVARKARRARPGLHGRG